MAEYSLQQKAFVFSMISSGAANMTGTPKQLEQAVRDKFAKITTTYPQYLGTPWKLAWGPVVHEEGSSGVADNTAFVAQGAGDGGKPLYIVAIAGTNPVSAFDIYTEDLSVHDQVAFGGRGQGKISNGTHIGRKIIEELSDGGTLLKFLTDAGGQNATVVFAGHSLGGALAPTVALDYVAVQGLDSRRYANIYVCPTAGPTPGDLFFSSLYKRTFPARDGFNENLKSSLDAVPHAWSDLGGIKAIYEPHGIKSPCINFLISVLQAKIVITFYSALPNREFTATFNEDLKPPVFPDDPDDHADLAVRFAMQALYQHINGYIAHLIPELLPELAIPPLTMKELTDIHNGCKKLEGGKTDPG
jgi:pimeloyl-ACP methyl ester carboxylesterase